MVKQLLFALALSLAAQGCAFVYEAADPPPPAYMGTLPECTPVQDGSMCSDADRIIGEHLDGGPAICLAPGVYSTCQGKDRIACQAAAGAGNPYVCVSPGVCCGLAAQ